MDSFMKINLKTVLLFSLVFAITIDSIQTQLNPSDLNYMKKFLLSSQDETTGLFSKSVQATYKSVFALKTLGESIPHLPKICREVSFEAMNKLTLEIVELNNLLDCKL